MRDRKVQVGIRMDCIFVDEIGQLCGRAEGDILRRM